MTPFNVVIPRVADPELGPLLTRLAEAGYSDPVVERVQGGDDEIRAQRSTHAKDADLPSDWSKVTELTGQSYRWPEYLERYYRYEVFQAETGREGTVHVALGHTVREGYWGRDRGYVIAFLARGAPQTPLVEFLETDDHDETQEYLAVIRGLDGGRKMFGPGDSLPDVYRRSFRTEIYNQRIGAKGAWNKVAVIAGKDDRVTMLNHALVQARRRGDL